MILDELKHQLLVDLSAVGVNVQENFELVLRNYSKTYYGRYYPDKNRVVVYVYEDNALKKLYPYEKLFSTALHECVHHIQWSSPDYKRVKGVMHNTAFYRMFNSLLSVHKQIKGGG